MDDNVLFFDARGFEGLEGAAEEGVDDLGVPAGVDDADAEVGAWRKGKGWWLVMEERGWRRKESVVVTDGEGSEGRTVVGACFADAFYACHDAEMVLFLLVLLQWNLFAMKSQIGKVLW